VVERPLTSAFATRDFRVLSWPAIAEAPLQAAGDPEARSCAGNDKRTDGDPRATIGPLAHVGFDDSRKKGADAVAVRPRPRRTGKTKHDSPAGDGPAPSQRRSPSPAATLPRVALCSSTSRGAGLGRRFPGGRSFATYMGRLDEARSEWWNEGCPSVSRAIFENLARKAAPKTRTNSR